MEKKRIQIIVTVFLGVIMVFLWINSIKTVGRKISVNKAIMQASKPIFPAPAVVGSAPQPAKPKEGLLGWVRDPFSGQSYMKVKKSESAPYSLDLTGIMLDKDKPVALINNRIVGIGGRIGENRVVDIKSDRVIFNNGENDFEIKLK